MNTGTKNDAMAFDIGNHNGVIDYELDGERGSSADPSFPEHHHGKLKIFASHGDDVLFLYGLQECGRDDYKGAVLKPSSVLYKGTDALFVWALKTPAIKTDPSIAAIADYFGMDLDAEAIPIPGYDGWELIHNDADIAYSIEDVTTAYLDLPEEAPADIYYGDAKVITPYNEADYFQLVTVTLGSKRESKQWRPQQMPLGALIAKLCRHEEGNKDGPAVVFADMSPGQRLKLAVKDIGGIGLDIDTGEPGELIDAKMRKFGYAGVRYTTHSNNKTISEIRKDKILKHFPDADEITTEMMQEFCANVEHWYHELVPTIEYIDVVHTEKGILVRIAHAKKPKHRLFVALSHNYVIANEGRTQIEAMAKWAKVPAALADLLGVPFDRSCTDPSRMFYLPRHPKGRDDYTISLFGGPLFDWRSLKLDGEFEALERELNKSKSKSVTPEGKALGKWSMKTAHGFQIVDLLEANCPDRIRTKATAGYNIECPFDEDHSNSGDTDDTACMAVNAAEGANEFFTCSCRHESCRDKTFLDMLGKMIKDEWFEEAEIHNPDYNIAEEDDAPAPEAAATYSALIDALKPESSADEVEEAIALSVRAKLNAIKREDAVQRIAGNKKWSLTAIRSMFKEVEQKAASASDSSAGVSQENGVIVFRYHGRKPDFHEASDVCVAALLDQNARDRQPTMSTLGGSPVLLTLTEDGKARFRESGNQDTWSKLSTLVKFKSVSKEQGDGVSEKVPEDVAKHVHTQSDNFLPPSPKIIYAPTFLSDGTLLQKKGYSFNKDKPAHLNHLLLLRDGFEVPKLPSRVTLAMAKASLGWIRLELLNDFPFSDTNDQGVESREPGEAHALAMILTPFMRPMIKGQTPIFFPTKPKGGTGGSLLGKLAMLLADGEVAPPIDYTDSEDEMGKRQITHARTGNRFMFFDDVKRFDNRQILRTVTSSKISGRLLNSNDLFDCDNDKIWIATGNNPLLNDQMDRRTVYIRLNAKKSDLTKRKKFRHCGKDGAYGLDYEGFVKANRGECVKHVLTLIQYWIQQKQPAFLGKSKDGFENWSEKVGGVLDAVGVSGFLQGRSGVIASQEEVGDQEFIAVFVKRHGVEALFTPRTLFDLAVGAELSIIRGKTDELKREAFFADLRRMNDMTFAVSSADGVPVDYMLVSQVDAEGLRYKLVIAPNDRDGEA